MKITIDRIHGNQVYFTVQRLGYKTMHYMTNENGEGLFEADNYYHQYKGTAQFSLPQRTRSGLRKAIIRQLHLDEEDE